MLQHKMKPIAVVPRQLHSSVTVVYFLAPVSWCRNVLGEKYPKSCKLVR